jgi:hypothetical protein
MSFYSLIARLYLLAGERAGDPKSYDSTENLALYEYIQYSLYGPPLQFLLYCIAVFLVPYWRMKPAMASGCRTGPPAGTKNWASCTGPPAGTKNWASCTGPPAGTKNWASCTSPPAGTKNWASKLKGSLAD